MEAINTIEHAGLRIEILQDTDATSPREADNLGILAFQQGTHLESEGPPVYGVRGFNEECPVCEGAGEYPGQAVCEKCDGNGEIPMAIKDYFAELYGAVEALPVRYADYGSSGAQAWITDDPEDANGVIYTTQQRIDTMGVPANMTDENDSFNAEIIRILKAEVEEFSLWLEGNVYGYSISGPEGEDLGKFGDSCFGFIAEWESGDSWKYFMDEAKRAAEGVREALDKERTERAEWAARDVETVC